MQAKLCRANNLANISQVSAISAIALFACTQILPATPAHAQQAGLNKRGLPPCNLDSFVYQSGGRAEAIYGDEGIKTPPPYFGFSQEHRIDAGIMGVRDEGLTTGHTSQTAEQDQRTGMDTRMPSAWGYDEFTSAGGEWVRTGHAGVNNRYSGANDGGVDYSQEINAYANTVTSIGNQINAINQSIMTLTNRLNTISPADIKGRQDITSLLNNAYTNRTNLNSQLTKVNDSKLPAGFGVGSH